MSTPIIPIGPKDQTPASGVGHSSDHSLGSFISQIGSYLGSYDNLAGFLNLIAPDLLPTLPFVATGVGLLGDYLSAIEDHKFDQFVTPIGYSDPDRLYAPSPVSGGVATIGGRNVLNMIYSTGGQQPSVSADAPRGFIATQ